MLMKHPQSLSFWTSIPVLVAIAVAIASNMTFFVCDGRKELLVIFRENQLVNAQ